MKWSRRIADCWRSILMLGVLSIGQWPNAQAQQANAPAGAQKTIPASPQAPHTKELSMEEQKRLQEEWLREPPAKELIKTPPAGPSGLRMEKSDSIRLSWISSSVTLRNYRVYRVEANGLRTLLAKVPHKKLPELERIEIVLPAASAGSLDDIYVSAVSLYGYESGLIGNGRRYLPPSQVKFDD